MGRPLRCIPQPSQFIGYSSPQVTSTTSTTSTVPPEDISKYINIPISGFPCPVGAFTTTSTTSTTLSPMALDGNINQCSLYNVTIIFENQEVEIDDCSKLSNIPSYGSAVIRYQPCSGTLFINELINTNSFLCVAGTGNVNNIRAISGKTNISRIGRCDSNIITTTTSTTQTPQIITSTTTTVGSLLMPAISMYVEFQENTGYQYLYTEAYGSIGPEFLDNIPALKNAGYIPSDLNRFYLTIEYSLFSSESWATLPSDGYIFNVSPLSTCFYGCGQTGFDNSVFTIDTSYLIRARLNAVGSVLAGPWEYINYCKTENQLPC